MALRNAVEPDLSEYDPACTIDSSLLENCKPHHREAVRLAMTDLYGKRMEALIRLRERRVAALRAPNQTPDLKRSHRDLGIFSSLCLNPPPPPL